MFERLTQWIRAAWRRLAKRPRSQPADLNGPTSEIFHSFDDVAVRVALHGFAGCDIYSIDVAVRAEPVQTIVLDAEQAEQFAKLLESAAGAVRELDRYHATLDTPRHLPTVQILDRTFYIDERLGQMRAVDNAYDFVDLQPN